MKRLLAIFFCVILSVSLSTSVYAAHAYENVSIASECQVTFIHMDHDPLNDMPYDIIDNYDAFFYRNDMPIGCIVPDMLSKQYIFVYEDFVEYSEGVYKAQTVKRYKYDSNDQFWSVLFPDLKWN